FAGGILAGLGSVFFLLFNGLYIGAILGHLTQVGLGPQIHSFIAGHSALELLAIVISGAAGLKLGQGLLFPGRRSRRLALLENARIALRLMLGAALMFFAAAAVEGYFSPMNLPNPLPKYLVGALFWVLLLGYFLRAGRPRGA
ncbi:MAG: stage II sporulation protein M, partial [Xanthomonadales bacterium]|nr:stage II sporulation protein M [Xanthomonadales bacterium]